METELARKEPKHPPSPPELAVPLESSPLRKIIAVASIAAGSQFCWALQFSLLTPYVQLLGIPHAWASLIWLCGPVSGMVVQPIVGYHSDRSTSRFGRRSPFIAAGATSIVVAVLLIGYAADLGHLSGDKFGQSPKTRAIAIFVVGFWMLDVANNMLQGPCRALLADLSGCDQKKTGFANALFSFFMAVGFFLGYAAGSYTHLYKMLPFTKTQACDANCANLKTCFFIAVALLSTLTFIALTYVKEMQWSSETGKPAAGISPVCYFGEIYGQLKSFNRPMWILLLVTCLSSSGFFPYLLYNTDWMGREVYGGSASGSAGEIKEYNRGVRAGAVGLMLSAVVLGITSLSIEMMGRKLGKVKRLWGIGNFVLAIAMASTTLITKVAESNRKHATVNGVPLPPSGGIKAAALTVFATIGFPQSILLSVPFALASIFSNTCGAGQGLSLGVLNLSITIPQLVMSLTTGPFDALFGGGNLPAFVLGAIAAATSGLLVLTILPSPPPDASTKATTIGFH